MGLVVAVHAAPEAEAEAEADPAVLYANHYGYGGYGHYGYGYGLGARAYGYGGYYGLGGYYGGYYGLGGKSAPCVNSLNVPVPCAVGRKRRDAEAAPEAEADPAYLYGGYYGYGRRAYGYGGYYGYPYAYGK